MKPFKFDAARSSKRGARRTRLLLGRMSALLAGCAVIVPSTSRAAAPADLIVTNARIYTADARHSTAEAMAISGGKIVFVGNAKEARALAGPASRTVDAHGKLVLPGLIDSHMHPTGTIEFDTCDLGARALSLAQISAEVKACVAKMGTAPGVWAKVTKWEYGAGNRPDAQHPDLRAALDGASAVNPILMQGWDGHHGAYNSLGLAKAKDASGREIGYSRATLNKEFSDLLPYVGVRSDGEPNGMVNDLGKKPIDTSEIEKAQQAKLLRQPEKISELLNSRGITAVQDAATGPFTYAIYDALAAQGRMTFRLTMAQFFVPEDFRDSNGTVDYKRLFSEADTERAKYSGSPLVAADVLKVFADGVVESDPNQIPPSLGNSPLLTPYLQPIMPRDADGGLSVSGYVDRASPVCGYVRGHPSEYSFPKQTSDFQKRFGYHPGQCAISFGVAQHAPDIFMDYIRLGHEHGYTIHIHTIGDAATRMSVDALEAAWASDGKHDRPDTLAHVEFATPSDVQRIGADHIYIAYTYSWIYAEPDGYDLSIVPFYNPVHGRGYAAFHDPKSPFEQNYYPVKASKDAGAILIAGSDAPVLTSDPQPFVNMEFAITRARHGLQPTSPWQTISVRDVLDAYTINGAHALRREREIGSLEPGKSADFIIVDQDILALADAGLSQKIGETKVLQTWFMGKQVYHAAGD
jgi:predicted amidohydrolase YtcJ